MSNYDLEEDYLLRMQIVLSFIFVFTLFVSITLSYNSMMECEGKNKIYTDSEALNVLKINRIIAFAVAVGFLIINIKDNSIKNKYGNSSESANLQICASILTLISSLIVLLVAFSSSNNIVSNENPEI